MSKYLDKDGLERVVNKLKGWTATSVGGRNLIKGTSMSTVWTFTYPTSGYNDKKSFVTTTPLDSTVYTLSFWAKSTVAGDKIRTHFYDPNTTTEVYVDGTKYGSASDGLADITLTTSWKKYRITYYQSATNKTKRVICPRMLNGAGTGTVSMKGVKFEEGEVATDWSPAPEDTVASASNADTVDNLHVTGWGKYKNSTSLSYTTKNTVWYVELILGTNYNPRTDEIYIAPSYDNALGFTKITLLGNSSYMLYTTSYNGSKLIGVYRASNYYKVDSNYYQRWFLKFDAWKGTITSETKAYAEIYATNGVVSATIIDAPTDVAFNTVSGGVKLIGTQFIGSLNGNATFATNATNATNATTASTCSGNSATTTKLKTAINVNTSDSAGTNSGDSVSFDGSSDIIIPLPRTIEASLQGNATSATNATNADKLDGYHATDLFTSVTNENNKLSVTVGGTVKTVDSIPLHGSKKSQHQQGNYVKILGFTTPANSLSPTITFTLQPTECQREQWDEYNINIRNRSVSFYALRKGTATHTIYCVTESTATDVDTYGVYIKVNKNEWDGFTAVQVTHSFDCTTIDPSVCSYVDALPTSKYVAATATGAVAKLANKRTLTVGNTGKSFDGSGDVSWSLDEIGAVPLNSNNQIDSKYLPSYVDDVLEYAGKDSFPASGETGKIYVDTKTNLTYRWGGTAYVEISPSLALGETSSTAYAGDKGKTAYDHSQVTSGNPHKVTKSDVGLGNVDNTADANKSVKYATSAGSATTANRAVGTGRDTYIAAPSDATYVSTDATKTGYLIIKLPVLGSCTMLSFFVDVYNYSTGNSITYKIAGYNFSQNTCTWYYCTATPIGSPNKYSGLKCRFGYKDNKAAISIGEADTVWSYPQVAVRDVLLGYSNYAVDKFYSGWNISINTTAITESYGNNGSAITMAVNANNADTLDSWHKDNIVCTGFITSPTASLSSYWCKLWDITLGSYQYNDITITMLISANYYPSYHGIITVGLRQEGAKDSKAYAINAYLKEIVGNIPSTAFRLYYDNTTGVCELWGNVSNQYGVIGASILKKSFRAAIDSANIGTLYSTTFTTVQTLPTSTYKNLTYNTINNNSATASKVNNSLTVKLNSGDTEGTSKFTFDGSTAKSVNITPSAIGAASSSHTHDYLPLSGGTMTGLLTNNKGIIVQGRIYGSGDDEGLLIKDSGNGYAGLILRATSGQRTVFYDFNKKTFVRRNNGTSQWDIYFPDASGTIALTSDSLKNPNALTAFGVSYDGSAAKTVDKTTFVGTLAEGTSNVTDGTMFITSYASDNGFADTNAVNTPYKRKASCLYNYIKGKTDTQYVTEVNTSGDYLTYKKNGTTVNLGIPNADKLDGKHWTDIKIGGRNYYKHSSGCTISIGTGTKDESIHGYSATLATSTMVRISNLGFNGVVSDWTVSCYLKASVELTANVNLCDVTASTAYNEASNVKLTTKYVKHTFTFLNVAQYHTSASYNGFLDIETSTTTATIYVKDIKIERGTIATDWSLAPEDAAIGLAIDTGTASITLAHGSTYKLSAGGTSVIFKMPTDNNTTYNFNGTNFYSGNKDNSEHNANSATKNGHYYYSSNGPATSIGASTADGALYVQSYNDSWVGQIAQDYRTGRLFFRGKNNGTWQSWLTNIDSGNYTDYAATKDHTHTFNSLNDKPTTISGYGITDGVNTVTTSGSGNAITGASVSGHTLTLTKGTFLTSHQDISGKLDKSGGTMTGVLNLLANQYTDARNGALNMNNSDIYGLNSIYTADKSDSQAEGIHFWRSDTTVDTFRMADGKMLFTPNRTLGSTNNEYTVLHSGNYTSYASTNTALTKEDLNAIKTPGFYNAGGGNTCISKPTNVAHFGLLVIHNASGEYYTQILTTDTIVYKRHCVNGTWGNWSELKFTDTHCGYCDTASTTAAKVVYYPNYVERTGNIFILTLANANTYAGQITLNVNGTGAKNVVLNGGTMSSNLYNIPAGNYLVYYDGTNYHINNDNTAPIKVTNAYSASKVTGSLSWSGYNTGSYDGSGAKSFVIPNNTNQLTNGAGFTTNKGTVTSVAVKMNGATKGTITTSGTIDLGTVLTTHQSLSNYLTKDMAANTYGNKVSKNGDTINGNLIIDIRQDQDGNWVGGNLTVSDNISTESLEVGDVLTANAIEADSIKTSIFNLPTTSGGTTYGVGSNGQVLKSNGTTVYWGNDNNTVYTLPSATSSTLGGVKVGSNITVSSGTISLTKANITSALGYTPPTTNTTYSVATTSNNGLMSSTDKKTVTSLQGNTFFDRQFTASVQYQPLFQVTLGTISVNTTTITTPGIIEFEIEVVGGTAITASYKGILYVPVSTSITPKITWDVKAKETSNYVSALTALVYDRTNNRLLFKVDSSSAYVTGIYTRTYIYRAYHCSVSSATATTVGSSVTSFSV